MKGQPTLFEPIPSTVSLPSSQAPRRGETFKPVRATSVETWKAQQKHLETRAVVVLMQLETCEVFLASGPVTSGELAQWMERNGTKPEMSWDARLLYVRRGLSDLARKGLVVAHPGIGRECRVLGTRCIVWRVKSR